MPTPPLLDVQRIIDNAPLSAVQRKAIAMTMAAFFCDGVDALVMAITAPSIAAEWGTTTASLTPAIVASLIGTIAGGIFLAPRADRYGRRPVLIVGVAIFAVLTLCVGAVQNIEQLVALRFLAGIGLGAVISNGFAYGAEFAPSRIRATVVTMIAASATAGAFVCGLVASAVVPSLGWRTVFVIGGTLPLLLIPALLRWLPETVQFLTLAGKHEEARSILRSVDARAVDSSAGPLTVEIPRKGDKPSIGLLFAREFASVTLLFCVVYFGAVLLMYFLLSWIPSVLTDAGFSTEQAVFASSICNLGAMIGGIILGTRIDRSRYPYRILSLAFLVAAVAIVVTALSLGSLVVMMISLFVVGAFSTGTQMGVFAVTTEIYPAWLRATGLGLLTAVGRIGSVVGPSIGGALLAAQLPAKTIFLLAVIPAVVAAAGMAAVGALTTSRRRNPAPSEEMVAGVAEPERDPA
ncbi:MFS transporter [Nocardia sp. NPDC127606]|uniref:MFS transporter n=1 Tax=Nocardia sp. NPDC127606 TaxID=3345406 RepID=UPI003642D79F